MKVMYNSQCQCHHHILWVHFKDLRTSIEQFFRTYPPQKTAPKPWLTSVSHLRSASASVLPSVRMIGYNMRATSLTNVQSRCILRLPTFAPFFEHLRHRNERLRRTSNPDFGPSCPRNPLPDGCSTGDSRQKSGEARSKLQSCFDKRHRDIVGEKAFKSRCYCGRTTFDVNNFAKVCP